MADAEVPAWVERTTERSAQVQRSRMRTVKQSQVLIDAAGRLIRQKGDTFTTQDLIKEAGVALQTFYRYFTSKDELLLAVLGDMLARACAGWANAARDFPDPLARLHFYITSALSTLDDEGQDAPIARFVVFTHWRLHRVFPDELAEVQKPFVDLLRADIEAEPVNLNEAPFRGI